MHIKYAYDNTGIFSRPTGLKTAEKKRKFECNGSHDSRCRINTT